ncbi:hypothetical protein [Streptomyces sp. NPDC002676]
MTQTDIALLLADAADEVEIGIAPVQAVMRGGRRRRARRWAVTATTALVLAGTTGALAVTGLPGGGPADGEANVAKPPASAEARHVYDPQETELSSGMYRGHPWYIAIQVWGAPRNEDEAARQFDAMDERRLEPADVHKPADLIGKVSYFVTRKYGVDRPRQIMFNTVTKLDRLSGTDMESMATRLGITPESSGRLVVGDVAKTAREVTCTWKDGTKTVARSGTVNYRHNTPDAAIVPAAGYPAANWFVCVAPEHTSYESAEVTK